MANGDSGQRRRYEYEVWIVCVADYDSCGMVCQWAEKDGAVQVSPHADGYIHELYRST